MAYVSELLLGPPPPLKPGNPALSGSRPLVTPYSCRLGDLLCFICVSFYHYFVCICVFCVFFAFLGFLCSFFLQYFDTVGWGLLTCKNCLPYNLYCVGWDVKPCSTQSNTTRSTEDSQLISGK